MKRLYESILGSNNAGLAATIKEWVINHTNLQEDEFEVDKNNLIHITIQRDILRRTRVLKLNYSDYDELPPYVKFADNEDLWMRIEQPRKCKQIKSFNGLPHKLHAFSIMSIGGTRLPKIDMELQHFTFGDWLSRISSVEGINLKYNITDRSKPSSFRFQDIDITFEDLFKNAQISGKVERMIFRVGNEEWFGKLIRGKAPMNNRRFKPTDKPLTPEAQDIINNLWKSVGCDFNMDFLMEINYIQTSKLVKDRGIWYRRPGD